MSIVPNVLALGLPGASPGSPLDLRGLLAGLAVLLATLWLSRLAVRAQQRPRKQSEKRRRLVATVVVGYLLLAAGSVAAEEAPAENRLQLHGFLDVPFAYNFNRPADHANFFPGAGTSAKRDNEFSLNLAQLELSMPASPVGFRLALGVGTATEVVHSFEPVGTAVRPEVWKQVVRASVQYQTGLGRGLVLGGKAARAATTRAGGRRSLRAPGRA